MTETRAVITYSGIEEKRMIDSTISILYSGYDIKYYLIKEAEFFNSTGESIGSSLVSISPVLEIHNYNYDRDIRRVLFEIPFRDEGFRTSLANNHITLFSPEEKTSYLSFFLNRKFRTEYADTFPAAIKETMRELGFQYTLTDRKSDDLWRRTSASLSGARLVTKELNKSDAANYQIFYPEFPEYGLKNLFGIISDCINEGKPQLWDDFKENSSILSSDEIRK